MPRHFFSDGDDVQAQRSEEHIEMHRASKQVQIDKAYRTSESLSKYVTQLRDSWSVLKHERLAEIFGTYASKHDLWRIDLPMILQVDEWLEHQAQRTQKPDLITDATNHMTDIEESLFLFPATSIFGVICKLLIWTRLNEKNLDYQTLGESDHKLAYAAYCDLINLTGFYSIASPLDIKNGLRNPLSS